MTTASFDWTLAETDETVRGASRGKPPIGPELRAILARKDDRLLRDIGLTRERILGPEAAFRAEQRGMRDIWDL